jgi:GNAT superfamily N-acetyltransferase
MVNPSSPESWQVRPLGASTWADFETLFGARGACGGCWCMHWRLRGKAFGAGKGEPNRRAMKKLAGEGVEPGLIGYFNGSPVAWCAVAPRESYDRLEHSKTLGRIDEEPVWSVVCLFVLKPFRRRGLSVRMVEAAANFARSKGARWIEGYPVETGAGGLPDPFVFTGLPRTFARAGFTEVARRAKSRPIFRKKLD